MKTHQIVIIFSCCQTSEKKIENSLQQSEIQKDTLPKAKKSEESLVLTSGALQLVDQITGASNELPFGTPENQLTEIINNTLKSKAVSIGVNAECSAGPLKMVAWSNGLTVVFQENNTKSADLKIDWLFQGWFIDVTKEGANKLTTLAEIQSDYEIDVKKTSFGQEFSTASGLHGILDGTGKNAKIIHLWSGVSCNFR